MNKTSTIRIHNKDYISNCIYQYGFWKISLTEILNEILNSIKNKYIEDCLFIDIGANIGYFSILSLSKNINVLAFEPIVDNYRKLYFNCSDNSNIDNYNIFMTPLDSENNKNLKFEVFLNNMGSCCIENKNKSILKIPPNYYQSINSKTLDYYYNDYIYFYNNLIVKISVEGNELNVLKGMYQVLNTNKIKYLIIEIHEFSDELFDILIKNGYIFTIDVNDLNTDLILNLNSNHLKNKFILKHISFVRLTTKYHFISSNKSKDIIFIK